MEIIDLILNLLIIYPLLMIIQRKPLLNLYLLMIRKITNIPKLNIIIDELAAETGLITRLESFIDILEGGAN